MAWDFRVCITRTLDHGLSDASRLRLPALKRDIDAAPCQVMGKGQGDGSPVPGDPRIIAFTLAGARNRIARSVRPDGPDMPLDLARSVTETLMRGLLPRRLP